MPCTCGYNDDAGGHITDGAEHNYVSSFNKSHSTFLSLFQVLISKMTGRARALNS